MKKTLYLKDLEAKYLISGPAPLGRILNYINRIADGQYQRSRRGELKDPQNLDNWTVCFMVGLGLLQKLKMARPLQLVLTPSGQKIRERIRSLPPFLDRSGLAKADMIRIKEQMRRHDPDLYKLLKETFLASPALKNLAIFLKTEHISRVDDIQEFYKQYGQTFSVWKAGFNRLPSLIQTAQFCDVLIEDADGIVVYDADYLDRFTVSTPKDSLVNILSQDLKSAKTKKPSPEETEEEDLDEGEFLKDLSDKVPPEKKSYLATVLKRNKKISAQLKRLYGNACQICGFTFCKKNGRKYSEAHHLIPLGENGSDVPANLIIVCANCHRQLHYAVLDWEDLRENARGVRINGKTRKVNYHPAHYKITIKSL